VSVSTLLIINPGSRSGNMALDELIAPLGAQGNMLVKRPMQAQDLPEVIRRHGPEFDRVVLGGGDGTINLALDGLLEIGRPVGLLPLGTANDLARSLQIPQSLEQAVSVIVSGQQRPVDIAVANGKSFINAIGMGLGPQMTRELDSQSKSDWGVLAYPVAMLNAIREPRRFHAVVVADGHEESFDCVQITVANGIHYGGGLTIVDDAKLDDGRLDVLIVHEQNRVNLLASIDRLRSGRTRTSDTMWHIRCQELSISTDPVLDVSFDGEILASTPLNCMVKPHALRFFAPNTGAAT